MALRLEVAGLNVKRVRDPVEAILASPPGPVSVVKLPAFLDLRERLDELGATSAVSARRSSTSGAMFPQETAEICMLEHRARARGVEVETVGAPIGDPLPEADLYILQGAEDEDQPAVARLLAAERSRARPRPARWSASAQATRSSAGASRRPAAARRLGSGSWTSRRRSATTWTTAWSGEAGLPASSATSGTEAVPRSGRGRSRSPRSRSAFATAAIRRPTAPSRAMLGTYLHGPLLPRNPELADLLLGWALGTELEPLRSEFAVLAREERIAEAREVWHRKQGLLSRFR